VGIIPNEFEGSVGLLSLIAGGSVGIVPQVVNGVVGLLSDTINGSVGVLSQGFGGSVGIFCTPETNVYLRVTPQVLWLAPDTDEQFDIESNTSWNIS
jgi:hypothetical protein